MDDGTKLFMVNDFRFIERRLRAIIDTLESKNYSSTFLSYSVGLDVDPGTKNKVLDIIEAMLSEIQQLKEEFGLEGDEALKEKLMSTWMRSGLQWQIQDSAR